MEKINISELLRDCPQGMELDCTMWDNLYFDRVEDDLIHCYYELDGYRNAIIFLKDGCYTAHKLSKCVIFPKGKTTWEGFIPPCQFKDGDIIFTQYHDLKYVSIIKQIDKSSNIHVYCLYGFTNSVFAIDEILGNLTENLKIHFATDEEKQKLFQAIKDNGYHWNNKTKTLEELPKFKDGDVVVAEDSESQLFLLKKYLNKDSSSHDGYCYFGWNFRNNTLFEKGNWRFDRLATKEEKEKLFQIIKDNGYRWDEKTKTLEKLSIFKVGDRIRHKDSGLYCTLGEYAEGISAYRTNIGLAITPTDLEQWELVPDKFDINTLTTFDRVLVRDFDDETWEINFFSRLLDNKHFKCLDLSYVQCIPYEGNEYLRGTTNACKDYFKIWEK